MDSMSTLQLVIGNKNYSSWSMRPWVLLKHFGIAFEEIKLRFDFTPGSDFYRALGQYTPTHKVPVLLIDGYAVWDTLAITETIADLHPDLPIWPTDRNSRARARSMACEMHAGFGALRSHCPMNIEADLREVGQRLWAEQEAVRADIARIDAMWCGQLSTYGGPFLCGDFSAVDAYYAPVAARIRSYGLPVSGAAQHYVQTLWTSPGVAAWVAEALAEKDFLDFEEPYRQRPV
jgi:glutathione S-transferase